MRKIVDLDELVIHSDAQSAISLKQAKHYNIFPVMKEKHLLVLAMSEPEDIFVREELQFITGYEIKPLLCAKGQIDQYIDKYYQLDVKDILKNAMQEQGAIFDGAEKIREEVVDFSRAYNDDASLIQLVNKLINDAIEARASDVHIEPQDKSVRVRYRIDGDLKQIIEIPRDLQKRIAARIKVLAKMNIAEQRKVQEGRIKALLDGKKIDMRISLIPTFHGEKIVIRILDSSSGSFSLDVLGFQPEEREAFKEAISRPQGVVLVTGPTGSGKTTTLYSALQQIKCETKNIVTIEDPIEYLIEGVNQLQLNHFKDVTFASGLKSILRQDPNVILIGEIRDKETAEIAFRASLTGHMVFSTLHTNNAVSSITRLMDIGLESYLIASSMTMLVAQRLVRLVCPACAAEETPEESLLTKFQDHLKKFNVTQFYRGRGCDHCNFSGFYGRTSIYEILKVTEKIKKLIYNKESEEVIFKRAVADGMRTLVESGMMKVAAGLTTLSEIGRITDVTDEQAQQQSLFPDLDLSWQY